ncbi:twin-arginine translocase TatA/TatE family subunit [Olsenella sp. oral taxon 807]|uniref:Sec-independent protein translocase subunit TatA/TatB n=1 Tax=Olsenella sp. oral taxon 807 TaxID=712411 RepID=UPI00067BDA91|nr:twin-arginine translocase TatA/TatE family subunit [Olsenella sp. oral taxon 807]
MFGIGETELVIIVTFAFLLFGPDKLPGMGRTIGRVLRQFRDAQEGFTKVVQSEVLDPLNEAMGDAGAQNGTKRTAALEEDADRKSKSTGKSVPTKGGGKTFAERKAQAKTKDRKAVGTGGEQRGGVDASALYQNTKEKHPSSRKGSKESGGSAPMTVGDVGAPASVAVRPTTTVSTSKRLCLLMGTFGRPQAVSVPKRPSAASTLTSARLCLLTVAMPPHHLTTTPPSQLALASTRRRPQVASTCLTPPTSRRRRLLAAMAPARCLAVASPERLHPPTIPMSSTTGEGE